MRFIKLILSVFLFLTLFYSVKLVNAQDVKTEYQVEYFLDDKNINLETRVKFNIKSTFYRSDVVIDNIAFLFPENFAIRNLNAYDDNGPLQPLISPIGNQIKVDLHFQNPKFGRGKENNINLEFQQDNLFKVSGNVWELILPTFANIGKNNYKVVVYLPTNAKKKTSISKPKPDIIDANKIIWKNVNSKTIYAVFGDRQNYQAQLKYNLKNKEILPAYSYIALPPDTLYQKVYFNSLNPQPLDVETDSDGNYLAKYLLKPKEEKTITLDAFFEINSLVREETLPFFSNTNFDPDKELLRSNKYWSIADDTNLKDLNEPKKIYQYVVNNLHYNYNLLNQNIRFGAQEILKNKDKAKCLDFTDLFIAIARKNSIRAREIEGFAYSQDKILRPLSRVTDILHSWPEYYDSNKKIWVPIDPTWGATSGIDYFNSLDLNHLTFVIHGIDPEYPLSAGLYKTGESKDIDVRSSERLPKSDIRLKLVDFKINNKINDRDTYNAKLVIKNESNIYLWNYPLEFKANGLDINVPKIYLNSFPPYAKKEINIQYKSSSLVTEKNIKFLVRSPDKTLYESPLTVQSYYVQAIQENIFLISSILIIGSFVIILRTGRKKLH